MKKIVLLSAFLSPQRSGAEAMVEEVAVRLNETYAITIVTGRYARSLPARDTLGGKVAVVRVGFGFGFDKYLFPFLAPFAAKKLKPEIVHAVLESYAGLALVFCTWIIPKAKRILTLQSTNTTFLLGPIHRSADTITAISKALIERAKKFTNAPVRLIPNGIDFNAIREACSFHPKDSGCVLFVGRLEPMKGVDTLLRAFAKAIAGLSPDIHLRIVGDGSEMNALKKIAAELEIDHRVAFIGQLSPIAVLDEFAKAEIFCGLSRSEAMGNVFLEAQAAGCAIVATRTGGIPEIVKDAVNGILVPVDDVDAAAGAIRSLLQDILLRANLAREAKQSVANYTWEGISKKYAEEYEKQ